MIRSRIPLCLLALTGAVAVAAPHWRSLGPPGGHAASVAVDAGGVVYGGLWLAGVVTSTDSGATWSYADAGLPFDWLPALHPDPSTPGTIYADLDLGPPYKSTDGGLSWLVIGNGLPFASSFGPMDIAASDPNLLYLAQYGVIYKSTDAGASWFAPAPSSTPTDPLSLAIDPTSPDVVYVGGWTGWLQKTTDGGLTWTQVGTGIRAGQPLYDIAIDPLTPTTVYASQYVYGVSKSTDGGLTFAPSSKGIPLGEGTGALAIDPVTPSTLYVASGFGIQKSTDGAATWTAPSSQRIAPSDIAIDPARPDTIYAAGAFRGLWTSKDGGKTWTLSTDGYSAWLASALAVDPSSPRTMYAAMYLGDLFRTENGGRSWRNDSQGLSSLQLYTIAVDPRSPRTIYAGTTNGLYKSIDGGDTFRRASAVLSLGGPVEQFAIDPTNHSTLYMEIASRTFSLQKSTDGGSHWFEIGGSLSHDQVTAIAIDPHQGSTLYVGTFGFPPQYRGIHKSTDGGMTFSQLTTGLPPGEAPLAIVIAPANPSTLYASFSAYWRGEVFRSTDAGASWTETSHGLPADCLIQALTVDPQDSSIVYAGTRLNWIYRTTDGGANWENLAFGLRNPEITSIVIPTPPRAVYAASRGSGIYELVEDGDILVGMGNGPAIPNRLRLFDAGGFPTGIDLLAFAGGSFGLNVGSGHLTGKMAGEILAAPGPGPTFGPQIKSFDRQGSPMPAVNFYAYGTLRFGAEVAAQDPDGDGYDEILTGAGSGDVFGPHARGWNYDAGVLAPIPGINFFAYKTLKYGVVVAGGNLDGDPFDELVTAPGPGPTFGPNIRGFDFDAAQLAAMTKVNFQAFPTLAYGARVAAGPIDGDGYAELVAAAGPGPVLPARLRGFDYDLTGIAPAPGYDLTLSGGSHFGARPGLSDLDADGTVELAAAYGPDPSFPSDIATYRYDGKALSPGIGFTAFSSVGYGANPAGAELGY